MDRLERPPLDEARAQWNLAVEEIPEDLRLEYGSRLLSKDDDNVIGAFCEIRLLRSLRALGLDVSLVPPTGMGSRGDLYLVATGISALVEVKVVLGEPDPDRMIHNLCRVAARHVTDCRLRVWINVLNHPHQEPSGKRFAYWINKLSHEVDDELVYHDKSSGLMLEVTRILRLPSCRQPESVFAGGLTRVHFSEFPLRSKVAEVLNQHKESSCVIVPAIACNDFANEPSLTEIIDEFRFDLKCDALFWLGPCYPWKPDLRPQLITRTGSPWSSLAAAADARGWVHVVGTST